MKSLLPMLLVMSMIACQLRKDEAKAVPDPDPDTTQVKGVLDAPVKSCYQGSIGQDTFRMELEEYKNVVTGRLQYLFHEKDQSNGFIKGVLHGDTLIADYTFNSEGTSSLRQVAFLLKDIVAEEGYGPMEEKDGKMIFKDWSRLKFEGGAKMIKRNCEE